jgi:hypothetical protein
MSIQHLFRRITLALGILLAATHAAHAQGLPNSVSEPEFVPGIEDLQLFEQPNLSSYGRGVQPPEGWFGGAEMVNWTVGTPGKVPIGNAATPNLSVYGMQGRTLNTGNLTFTLVTVTVNPPAPGTLAIVVPVAGTAPSAAGIGPTPVGSTNYNPGILLDPVNQTNAMDTGILQSDFTTGGRFEFGRMNGDRGWMVGSFNLGTQTQTLETSNVSINFANQPIGFVDIAGGFGTPAAGVLNNPRFLGDGYDDDLDGDGVYGRNGRDRGTVNGVTGTPPLDGIPDQENPGNAAIAIDWDDAVRLPTLFSNLQVSNKTGVYGVEAMRLWRLDWSPRGGVWELFGGARYLDITDTFSVAGQVDDVNPGYVMNPLGDTAFQTQSQNHILGLQLGGRWWKQTDRWQVSIETRLFAAANFQNVHQSGTFGSFNNTVVGGDAAIALGNNVPYRDEVVNMQLPSSFSSSFNGTEFTPGGELRFNLKYQVFRKMYLTLGYTALYADGIARASRMVVYRLPTLGINSGNNYDGIFMNGVNFGVVFNH